MKKIADRFSALLGIIISCIIIFGNWIYYKGTSYSIIGFYSTVKKYGSISKFAAAKEGAAQASSGGLSIIPAYIFLIMPLMIAFLLLLRAVLLLLSKNLKRMEYLSYAAYSIAFIYLLTMGMTNYSPTFLNLVSLLLLVPDYLGARFIVEKDEMKRKARELKIQEKLALEDKKRRMNFPGRYSVDFYQVVFANFKCNLKGYLLFILSVSIFCMLIYALNGAETMIDKKDLLYNAQILNSIKGVNGIILAVFSLLLVLIISNYIKTRMKNYGIFIGLGIRRKTLWLIIALEYVVSILSSLILGLILGNIFLPLVKLVLTKNISLPSHAGTAYGLTTLITIVTVLLTIGLATLVNYHLFEGTDITASFVGADKKEKLPSHLLIIGIIFGGYSFLSAIKDYLFGTQMEELTQLFSLLLGFLFLLYCGGTKLLKWYMKKEDRYLRNLFKILPWKYRFKTNAKYWFLLFAIQLLIFSVYLPQLSACFIAQPEKDLYPYDYVCLSHEGDDAFYNSLKDDFDVRVNTYPMFRVNTLLAEPYTFGTLSHTNSDGMVFPMGKHIGISESTYMKLKTLNYPDDKRKLHLKGKEIEIVFQQSTAQRARRLDWYYYPIGDVDYSGPHIKAGAASAYNLSNRDKLYPVYPVKGRERLILTGMTDGGDSEDIVVFSDSYFNKLEKTVLNERKDTPSPTKLVTIKASKKDFNDVSQTIAAYLKKNAADAHYNPADFPCYERNTGITSAAGERFFKEVGFIVMAILLILSSFFIFYLKYSLEIEDLSRRSRLLKSIGMGLKERKKILRTEMRIHSLWAYAAAFLISAFFWIAIPVTRLFHAKEAALYYPVFILTAGLYTLIYIFGMYLLEKLFVKKALEE